MLYLQGLLERLQEGVVVGDGGMVFNMEKRGYVNGGIWTTEAAVEHPEAGESEARCGSVIQLFLC